MKIDIASAPPTDIFRNRGKHIRLSIAFLALSVCGVLVGAYAVFSDTPHAERLEGIAFGLFIAGAVAFSFFCEKIQGLKRLTSEQVQELAELCFKHPEIKEYCDLVLKDGRQPVLDEFEACQELAKDLIRETS